MKLLSVPKNISLSVSCFTCKYLLNVLPKQLCKQHFQNKWYRSSISSLPNVQNQFSRSFHVLSEKLFISISCIKQYWNSINFTSKHTLYTLEKTDHQFTSPELSEYLSMRGPCTSTFRSPKISL